MENRQPIFNIPFIVIITLAILGGVHLVRALLPLEQELRFVLTMAFIPGRYTSLVTEIPGGAIAAYTSIISYMAVHADITHLMVNSVWLLAFGSAIAKRVGNIRYVVFSILCGVAGALLHLAMHYGELTPVIGASAAISGQMAAAMRFFFGAFRPDAPGYMQQDLRTVPLISIVDTFKDRRILIFLAIWIGLNVLFGLGNFLPGELSGIAWEAHIGGFVFGLLSFSYFDRRLKPRAIV